MEITLKLYAQLGQYLPDNAKANEAVIQVEDGINIMSVLTAFNVPEQMCHLVLVNGTYVLPSLRTSHQLGEGDQLAVWPPVAGG